MGPGDVPIARTAHPFTCLALELLGPAGQSCEYTCLPGYEEAKQLEIHVHCSVQEGSILGEGVFVKVGEEAEGETRCQVTPRPPREGQLAQEVPGHLCHLEGDPLWSDQNRELPVEGDWQQPDMLVRGQEEEEVTQAGIYNPRCSVSPDCHPPGPVSSEDLVYLCGPGRWTPT